MRHSFITSPSLHLRRAAGLGAGHQGRVTVCPVLPRTCGNPCQFSAGGSPFYYAYCAAGKVHHDSCQDSGAQKDDSPRDSDQNGTDT